MSPSRIPFRLLIPTDTQIPPKRIHVGRKGWRLVICERDLLGGMPAGPYPPKPGEEVPV